MKQAQALVREFHQQAGAVIHARPTVLDPETRQLRLRLLWEELSELEAAFDDQGDSGDLIPSAELESHVNVADALGDLLYVLLGTAVSCGIDLAPVFEEIHRSNMTKFIDGHRRADGKWMKGPGYTPPNLLPILEAQLQQPPLVCADCGTPLGETEGSRRSALLCKTCSEKRWEPYAE